MSIGSNYQIIFEDGEMFKLRPYWNLSMGDFSTQTLKRINKEQLKYVENLFDKKIDSVLFKDSCGDFKYIHELSNINQSQDWFMDLEGKKLYYKDIKKIIDNEDLMEGYDLSLKDILGLFIKHKDFSDGFIDINDCDYCGEEKPEYLFIRFEFSGLEKEYDFLDSYIERNNKFYKLNEKFNNYDLTFNEYFPGINFWINYCKNCGAITIELEPDYD